ncbi:MAG: cell division protein FtsQ/DivIB [Phototrophicaceae bacterium]
MSTLRVRQQKRKAERNPAVWRGGVAARVDEARPAVEHGERSRIGVSWRVISALIVVSFSLVLVAFFITDFFYVRHVTVRGARYVSEAEIFRYADIANVHVFWVNPETVSRKIETASPVIASARVTVGWPPDMVQIVIEEREPALIWVQAGVTALVDIQGRVLRFPSDNEPRPALMRVMAEPIIEGPPGVDVPVPLDAVTGALQLQSLLAGLEVLRYHPAKGLGFREPGGWDVWLGTGTDMPDKLLIYETVRDDLQARGITPVEINVAHPDAVYYCGSVELCHE